MLIQSLIELQYSIHMYVCICDILIKQYEVKNKQLQKQGAIPRRFAPEHERTKTF